MTIVTTSFEGEAYNHRELWHIATHLRSYSKARPQGDKYFDLPAMLMARLTVEAYANFLLHVIDPLTFEAEKKTFGSDTRAKIKWLSERVNLTIDWGRSPFQRLSELDVLRDRLVHSKPDVWSGSIDHSADEDAPFMQPGELDRLVSAERSEGSLKDVEDLCESLHVAALGVADPKQRLRLEPKALRGVTARQTNHSRAKRPVVFQPKPRA